MAMPHANLLDVISVAPLGDKLVETPSTSLIKTRTLQLLHMVLIAHQDQPQHHVANECVIQCLEGLVEVVTGSGVRQLGASDLVVLPAGQEHSLRARTDCAVLVTLLLDHGDAGDGGGGGNRRLPDKDTPVRP